MLELLPVKLRGLVIPAGTFLSGGIVFNSWLRQRANLEKDCQHSSETKETSEAQSEADVSISENETRV